MPINENVDPKPLPINKNQFTKLWKLFYKVGYNPRAELVFPFVGEKDEAINRGREHCKRMNYKFIHVEPFIVDLDATERNFFGVTEVETKAG